MWAFLHILQAYICSQTSISCMLSCVFSLTFYSAWIQQNLSDNLSWFKPMVLINCDWIFSYCFPDWHNKVTLLHPVCFPEYIWGGSPSSIGIIMFHHYLRMQSQAALIQICVSPIKFPVNCYIPISLLLSSCALILSAHSSTDCRWEEDGVSLFSVYNYLSSSQPLTLLTIYITLTHVDNSRHWSFVCWATEARGGNKPERTPCLWSFVLKWKIHPNKSKLCCSTRTKQTFGCPVHATCYDVSKSLLRTLTAEGKKYLSCTA